MPARIPSTVHAHLRDRYADMLGLARHAGWYDSVPGRLARPLYRRVAGDVADGQLPAGALVLDVGTGPGRVPSLIATGCLDLQVEGIDPSLEMIDRAVQNAAAEGESSERLRYTVGDVAHLPLPDNSVDLMVSTLSLHHWVDVPAGLDEIRRVLRPGSQAWIYDIRWVLDRASAGLPAGGLTGSVERLGRHAADPVGSSIVLNALIGRLRLQA